MSETKFCKDCKFYTVFQPKPFLGIFKQTPWEPTCAKTKIFYENTDLVSGKVTRHIFGPYDCSDSRNHISNKCGPKGKNFEPKET